MMIYRRGIYANEIIFLKYDFFYHFCSKFVLVLNLIPNNQYDAFYRPFIYTTYPRTYNYTHTRTHTHIRLVVYTCM